MNLLALEPLGRLCGWVDLHIYDHRSREVASKESKASRVELPNFHCPAGNHDSNVKTECTEIKSS